MVVVLSDVFGEILDLGFPGADAEGSVGEAGG